MLMTESQKLLDLKEVSQILKINTEVLRRWLRSGRLPGVKVGSDWRVNPKDLQPFLDPGKTANATEQGVESPQKMCFRFPKWLEFSGLPSLLNQKFGPEAWPIFKKLIELDFELGKPSDRQIPLDFSEIAERTGYDSGLVGNLVNKLASTAYISLNNSGNRLFFNISTPIRTPKLILDIPYEKGGVKGAPSTALTNSCLRRFLESGEDK